MSISLRITALSEVETLLQIQKAAFQPLYEKFHDEGNPFLRGAEDILWRFNKNNRYFTILYENKIVGGIFYRVNGRLSPNVDLKAGEYYLGRIYIHPDYQNKGIARKAILMCEKEFPDAKTYYVDFPKELEKNRRCYESAGYVDSGEDLSWRGNNPVLSMLKKTVCNEFDPAGVTLPVIYEVEYGELNECLNVIQKSCKTVADQFGLTEDNCPQYTSFMKIESLEAQMNNGWLMYALYAGKKIIGYMSLSKLDDGIFELHNLSVLPEYRHKGFGKQLLDYAKNIVKSLGGNTINISLVEEDAVMKDWYIANGFTYTGIKKIEHLPFTCEYLVWEGEQK